VNTDLSGASGVDAGRWPRWCCALLRDSRGRYILERRPADEVDAPGMLTCFGGGREPGEDPEACLRRELVEELGWRAGTLELCVELDTPKGVAWFYRGLGPEEGTVTALEPGFGVEWVEAAAIDTAGVGTWNVAAIRAAVRGERFARTE
jgi:8-oxo-dGTP pyrophosphatase MutT (NUDIX family)